MAVDCGNMCTAPAWLACGRSTGQLRLLPCLPSRADRLLRTARASALLLRAPLLPAAVEAAFVLRRKTYRLLRLAGPTLVFLSKPVSSSDPDVSRTEVLMQAWTSSASRRSAHS